MIANASAQAGDKAKFVRNRNDEDRVLGREFGDSLKNGRWQFLKDSMVDKGCEVLERGLRLEIRNDFMN